MQEPRSEKQLREKYTQIKANVRVQVAEQLQREQQATEANEFDALQNKEKEGRKLTVEEEKRKKMLTSQLRAFKLYCSGTGGGPYKPPPQFTDEEESLIANTKLSMKGLPAFYGSDAAPELSENTDSNVDVYVVGKDQKHSCVCFFLYSLSMNIHLLFDRGS